MAIENQKTIQSLPISNSVFWGSESFINTYPIVGYQYTEPDVAFLPLMQRRRLNFLSKIFFHVVNVCNPTSQDLPIVFGSRFGELPRTMKILQSLGANEPISPTDFSHSVHNTPVALYSIFSKNQQPVTAIAGGEDSFMGTLMEAEAQFKSTQKDVLFVYAEDKLPDPYTRTNQEDAIHGYGIALRISAEKPKLTLTWQKVAKSNNKNLQPAAFASGFYQTKTSFALNAFGSEYLFKKEIHA